MNVALFVQNVKIYSERKGVKPTAACRESGAGERLLENVKRGSEPSVGKVQALAHYLGTTVSALIGETDPSDKVLTLHDSAVVIQPDDFRHLSFDEMDMILAYRRATAKERRTIDGILDDYKKGTTSEVG